MKDYEKKRVLDQREIRLTERNNGYWTNGRFDLIQKKSSDMKDYEKKMGIIRTGDQTYREKIMGIGQTGDLI